MVQSCEIGIKDWHWHSFISFAFRNNHSSVLQHTPTEVFLKPISLFYFLPRIYQYLKLSWGLSLLFLIFLTTLVKLKRQWLYESICNCIPKAWDSNEKRVCAQKMFNAWLKVASWSIHFVAPLEINLKSTFYNCHQCFCLFLGMFEENASGF